MTIHLYLGFDNSMRPLNSANEVAGSGQRPDDLFKQALEALEEYQSKGAPFLACDGALAALRAALAQQDEPQTLNDAMQQPRAMAQAYENGYKAGAAAERKRIIQFLTEMQRQVGDGHNYYGVAAMRIRERV